MNGQTPVSRLVHWLAAGTLLTLAAYEIVREKVLSADPEHP